MPLKPGGGWSTLSPTSESLPRLWPGPLLGRPNPIFRPTADAPFECGRETERLPCAFPCLLLNPSFPHSSFPFCWKPCPWPRLYLFCFLLNPSPNRSPQKKLSGSAKTGWWPKRDSCSRALRGNRLTATSTPFSWTPYFLSAVADFYILVLAGFCPILSISCTFLFRFSVQMHDLFPLRKFKPQACEIE